MGANEDYARQLEAGRQQLTSAWEREITREQDRHARARKANQDSWSKKPAKGSSTSSSGSGLGGLILVIVGLLVIGSAMAE